MEIERTEIAGLLIIKPELLGDSRGYFAEVWNERVFSSHGIFFAPVQQNESCSTYGVVRGLHYQLMPVSQAKLVRVLHGEVLDVAVDLRKSSPTFGKHVAVVLSDENKKQFFIPKGFAHGFSVLSPKAVFSYLCDDFYNKKMERGINLNDPALNIDWRVPPEKRILSEKDLKHKNFNEAEYNF